MPKSTKVSKVVLSESEDEVMSGGEEEKQVVDTSESESESDTDSDTSSDEEQAGGAKKKPVKKPVKKTVKEEPVKKPAKKAAKSQEEKPKAKKAAKSQKEADDDKPAKKPSRSRKVKADGDKPKKELNPIMKEMNKFRNEVIGAHLGTKAPMKTIPPFKLAMVDARKQMKLGEKDKNTVEVVQKASDMFKANPSKYCD